MCLRLFYFRFVVGSFRCSWGRHRQHHLRFHVQRCCRREKSICLFRFSYGERSSMLPIEMAQHSPVFNRGLWALPPSLWMFQVPSVQPLALLQLWTWLLPGTNQVQRFATWNQDHLGRSRKLLTSFPPLKAVCFFTPFWRMVRKTGRLEDRKGERSHPLRRLGRGFRWRLGLAELFNVEKPKINSVYVKS